MLSHFVNFFCFTLNHYHMLHCKLFSKDKNSKYVYICDIKHIIFWNFATVFHNACCGSITFCTLGVPPLNLSDDGELVQVWPTRISSVGHADSALRSLCRWNIADTKWKRHIVMSHIVSNGPQASKALICTLWFEKGQLRAVSAISAKSQLSLGLSECCRWNRILEMFSLVFIIFHWCSEKNLQCKRTFSSLRC